MNTVKCKIVWVYDRYCCDFGGERYISDGTPWEEVSEEDFEFLRKYCYKLSTREEFAVLLRSDERNMEDIKKDIKSILVKEKEAEERRKKELEKKKLEKELKKKAATEKQEKELLKELKKKYE